MFDPKLTRLLNLMRLPAENRHQLNPPIYVLGCFASRVTLYSQQVRAHNLIYCLIRTGRLQAGESLCVIGAGAGGLTVAAAALQFGVNVTLLEQKEFPIPLFKSCDKRWLHPHIYDWPEEGWHSPNAELPILNWTAGLANEVRKQILDRWEAITTTFRGNESPRLREQYNAQLLALTQDVNPQVSWKCVDGPQFDSRFNAVVISVGFGLERPVKMVEHNSYWSDRDLEQLHLKVDPENPSHSVFISGVGDGGLIDAQRVCLTDFNHGKMHELVTTGDPTAIRTLSNRLLDIDANERSFSPDWLNSQYNDLHVPAEIIDAVTSQVHKTVNLILHTRERNLLQRNSSILNRLLVHIISKTANVKRISGELLSIRPVKGNNAPLRTVEVKGHKPFDVLEVVVRHGPDPEVEKEPFKSVLGRSRDHFRTLAIVDDSNIPLWPSNQDFLLSANGSLAAASRQPQPPTAPVMPKSLQEPLSTLVLGREGAVIRFEDICRVTLESVESVAQYLDGDPNARIVWHAQIRGAVLEIEAMYRQLDRRVAASARFLESPEVRQAFINMFLDKRETFLKRYSEINVAWTTLLMRLQGVSRKLQVSAMRSFAGFTALQLVTMLCRFRHYFLDEEGRDVIRVFADLGHRACSVALFPKRDALATGAANPGDIDVDSFFWCRVGPDEANYEYIYLPTSEAHLYVRHAVPQEMYYKWVLPQWLLDRGVLPPEHLYISLIKDEYGREHYNPHTPAPWNGDRTVELPSDGIQLGNSKHAQNEVVRKAVPACLDEPGGEWGYYCSTAR